MDLDDAEVEEETMGVSGEDVACQGDDAGVQVVPYYHPLYPVAHEDDDYTRGKD